MQGICNRGYVWNPSNCECECENCKWWKRLVDKLVEECNVNNDEAKLTEVTLFEHVNECVGSYRVCIVLAVIGIGAYFAYKYINRNKENFSKYDYTCHAKDN